MKIIFLSVCGSTVDVSICLSDQSPVTLFDKQMMLDTGEIKTDITDNQGQKVTEKNNHINDYLSVIYKHKHREYTGN